MSDIEPEEGILDQDAELETEAELEAEAEAELEAELEAEAAPEDDGGLLELGAWAPEVREALQNLILNHGIDSPGYDPEQPPVAVIDCSDTLLHYDLGEAMMRFMISRRRLRTDRGFWQVVPERFGRDALNAAHKAVAGRNDSEISETAAFRRYRAGMFGVYEGIRASEGLEEAALFAGRMIRGQHERTIAELVEEVLDHELGRHLGMEDVPAGPPFSGLVVPAGLRVYHEMVSLLQLLDTYGFTTWLIDSANIYVLQALARRIGFPEDRVIGLSFQIQGGSYTDRPEDLVPVGEDKLEMYLDTVGRSPVLVMGDSMADFELLENCEGLSIVMDKGDEELLGKAKALGWLVQAPLSV